MPEPTTRTRSLKKVLPFKKGLIMDGHDYLPRSGEIDLSGTQKTVSEEHQISQLGKTDLDIGGDFFTFKSEFVHLSHPYKDVRTGGGIDRWYTGPLLPSRIRPLKEDELPLRSMHELRAMGTTAISRCSPVDSQSEVLTSVSETLKDGLPAFAGVSTWRDRAQISKGAGSEYLNAQFGWIPLVSDVRAAVGATANAAKLLRQFKRDSGRNVRRSYEFPNEVETITSVDTDPVIGNTGLGAGSRETGWWPGDFSGVYETHRTITRKTWFSGAFTYHMPASDSQLDKVIGAYQMSDILYGTGLTPDVLWNLTPWSWATDWFANTGDVLSNISNAALYGQVLRYGYLMEKTTIIDRHSLKISNFVAGPGPYSAVVKTTVKRRVRASPYGFGVTWDGLDAYQLSILAALGITRR